ncbi:hypothetical protein D3C83_32550 [compost metagenome]
MLRAVAVEREPAGDAQARLERIRRIIDAGVDHLGIARAGMRADRLFRLEDHDLAPVVREPARDSEADHTGADHRAIDFFCHGPILNAPILSS